LYQGPSDPYDFISRTTRLIPSGRQVMNSSRGREIYLRLPGGVAASKQTNAYFDSKLASTSTSGSRRTVTKLIELMKA
jgi:hypothetical protein